MLKKIDCVLVRVNDVFEAANFYSDVFGLKLLWHDQHWGQAGLLFPDGVGEIILHCDPAITGEIEVHYLVDDVSAATERYAAQGCQVLAAPFDTHQGKCALIQDPFGTRLCLVDLSKKPAEFEVLQIHA